MCGIAGVVLSREQSGAGLRPCLAAMAAAMGHRGPDGEGVQVSADLRVGLANRRLAIRDRSPAGHMPMGAADGRLWITYNGEIYNAGPLRDELEAKGCRFRSTSDTEVVLQGYAVWGVAVVERLRGMFAFAIYDEREGEAGPRRLVLARDRLGIKPLYYSMTGGAATGEALVFASELRALRASGLVGPSLSPAAVAGYLMLGSVPGPLTIYQAIRALEPGTVATVEVADRLAAPVVRRYWALPADTAGPADPATAAPLVRAALEDAVRSHLISDAPLGAFLSGGLDSSAVVTLMRAAGAGTIRTCSMAFAESDHDESAYARAVAEAAGAEHFARTVTAEEVCGELPRIFRAMDQPTVDGVNTYFVARTAREAGLTVALSGLGGDELFGGYPAFAGVPRLTRAVRLARAVPGGPRLVRAGLRAHPRGLRWLKAADALDHPPSPARAYLAYRGVFAPSQVRALLEPELWEAAGAGLALSESIAEAVGDRDPAANGRSYAPDPGWFSWVSRAELATYTRYQLLRDTDVMGMAHSLEIRVPLLDGPLVETVLRLPAGAHGNGVGAKPLLRRAVGDLLPATVLARREKKGFVFPFERWLRGPLGAASPEWPEGLEGLLRQGPVRAVQRAWQAGHLHWSRPWALAALSGWRLAS
jgi:asparagine synthase (glutamine-hydrolysing)